MIMIIVTMMMIMMMTDYDEHGDESVFVLEF